MATTAQKLGPKYQVTIPVAAPPDAYVAEAPERQANEPAPVSSMNPATRERLRELGYAE